MAKSFLMLCVGALLLAPLAAQAAEAPKEAKPQETVVVPPEQHVAKPGPEVMSVGCSASCTTQGQPAITHTCTASGATARCTGGGAAGGVVTCNDGTSTTTCSCNPNTGCRTTTP